MTTQTAVSAGPVEYVKTVGITTNQSGRGFINPYDCAFSNDGRIFVLNHADAARQALIRIGILNWDEDYLGEFSKGTGRGEGQWTLPIGMAMSADQHLHVTDEHLHRVTVFDTEGEFVRMWGEKGDGSGQLNGPSGIVVAPDGRVYVAEQYNHRVQVFTAEGEPVTTWGEFGDGAGQFNMPWGVALDSAGSVYVADWRNDRIQKFTANGEHLATYGSSGDGDGQFSRPSAVAVDSEGYIYVADWGNERLQLLDANGNFVQMLRGQATLSKWAQDFMSVNPDEYNTRQMANLVPDLPDHLDTPYLISAQSEPYFWGPVSLRLDPEERLFVVEANRHRIQIYQRRKD